MGTLKKDLKGNLRVKYKVVELNSSLPLTWATLSPSEEWHLQCLLYEAISVCVQSPLKMDVGANDLLVLCVGDSAVLKNKHDDDPFRKHSCWIRSHPLK